MDIDAVLEAFKDFEKKGTKDTCSVLEQFLRHVAKTGETMIPWSQFKTYFLFKLEQVMDDFHTSTPEQRAPHNPNVEYISFDEMKMRILKIVDGYNGIPFTIQRLCELVTDPRKNYTGTDKFLRGVEKNVMVVSCVYPTSEKNGATSVNRVNGVMFPGNSSVYSDSQNVNGPATPKPLNRPKLSLTPSLSTNGLPDSTMSTEPEPTTDDEEEGEHHVSDSSLSEGESTPSSGIKNKHHEEDDDAEADEHEVKRLKFGEKEEDDEESDEKEPSCSTEAESIIETPQSSNETCDEDKSSTSFDTPTTSEDHEPSSTQTETSEREEETSERGATLSLKSDSTTDQSETSTSSEAQDSGESSSRVSSSSSDAESPPSDKPGPTSPSSTADLSTEGAADHSDITETANEPEEHD